MNNYKICIYPGIVKDGIGSYIAGINKYLKLPIIPYIGSALSPWFFLKKPPPNYNLIHVPHFVVPFFSSNAKIVCTIQDITPLVFDSGFNIIKKYYLFIRIYWSIKYSDYLIFTSLNTYNDVTRLFGEVKNYSIIPLAVDIERPINNIPFLFLKDSPYFICVGRRRPHKNTHRIIEAFASFSTHTNHHLVFVGAEDKYDVRYLALAIRLGIQQRVHFVGKVSQQALSEYYSSAVGLIFPSLYEGFGLPILEAMICGCPVITSSVASMPEVAGQAALYVDPSDVNSISSAMTFLADSEDVRKNLISKGYDQVKLFSWKESALKTIEVYQKVLSST